MSEQVVVLTGGVGGAKLVLGLTQVLPQDHVTAIVNTGDDFRHLGLAISPDLDTLLYTLSGKADAAQGWGREGETWAFMNALRSLGEEHWFLLGDSDLALHILRSRSLAAGEPLSAITRRFARAWGVEVVILPMSDDPVATYLSTDEGELPFQDYFVARRCGPAVCAIRFEGASDASPAPEVLEAIADVRTTAILIAPSNPWLSIDPILAVPAIREALIGACAPVVGISPLIAGRAVKGPTAKLMGELGLAVTNANVAGHYEGIIDGLLVDARDDVKGMPVPYAATDTLMTSLSDRERVARAALDLAAALAG